MNDWKWAITLATSCCICLTMVPSTSADYVGVATVIKDDPDTEFLCTQGNGDFVPGPLTVCNVYATFDHPADRLLSVVNGDMQVYNGAKPDVFFQHPLNPLPYPPACLDIPDSPDLICDSFVAFGPKCYYDFWEFSIDDDFDTSQFAFNGHIVGGWHTQVPDNGQGDAGNYPDLQVFFLQSSVAQGLSLSGDIDIFWKDGDTGETLGAFDVPIECAAVDQDPCECVDGRVTLCHIPPGNPARAHTITVGCAARDWHLAQGDTCGPCQGGDGGISMPPRARDTILD